MNKSNMNKGLENHSWKMENVISADVGNHYCVNPYLYTDLTEIIKKAQVSQKIVDIGAGTCTLAVELLEGATYLPQYLHQEILATRAKIKDFYCLEGSKDLLQNSMKHPRITSVEHSCTEKDILPFVDNSMDIVTSRQFIMHLDIPSYRHHMKEAERVLKTGGYYVFVCLNPAYEEKKAGCTFVEGERYFFNHAGHEITQYFKSEALIESVAQESFTLIRKTTCYPITNAYRDTHARYYDQECPMAFIYVFKK